MTYPEGVFSREALGNLRPNGPTGGDAPADFARRAARLGDRGGLTGDVGGAGHDPPRRDPIVRARSFPLPWRAGLLFLVGSGWAPAAPAAPPNVIVIVADDQGYGDLGAHGNPVLKTPNLDRLRSQSVRFTDFHVAPMCSPTRGQLMTGLDAMRNGATAVCQGRSMMLRGIPTLADFFAGSGYATGHFGKWHLGDSYPHRPQDRGFQETIHHRAWGITSLADHWGNTYFDPVLDHNGVENRFPGYCTDIFFDEAMKWMSKMTEAKKPFLVYLPSNTPHRPEVCAESYSAPYVGKHDGKPVPDKFYGMIANLDENLGKLERFLAQHGLRENTIVVYLTDNGTQSQEAKEIFNAGMRDKKTSVFDGGHRVPLFVRWPAGALVHGRDIGELTQVQDILPTLIELCGLRNPSRAAFDGTSLASLLKGGTTELPDRKLVVQYRISGEPWDSAVVMWDKWRLLGAGGNKSRMELYQVDRDPGQTTNVAARHPDIVEAMTKHYETWHAGVKPSFDQPRWITLGSEAANPVTLYAQDWVGDFCDNRSGLSRATGRGYWNVIVDREGLYEIELRRWPKESGKSMTEGWNGPGDKGPSARPIASAHLKLAGVTADATIKPGDTRAAFRVRLSAGKTKLETTFSAASNRALSSAFYVYVRRLAEQ